MKKLIFFVLLTSFTFSLFAQSIERQVIGSAGSAVSNTQSVFSFTVGEVSTFNTTAITGTATLTQGFQQAEVDDLVSVIEITNRNLAATVFPIPTVDILNIKASVELNQLEYLNYQIVDLQGKVVQIGSVNSNLGQIYIQNLAPSSYTLILFNIDKTWMQRVKFIKI